MKIKLKHCPFCGYSKVQTEEHSEQILCPTCCTYYESFFHDAGEGMQATIDKWNNRVILKDYEIAELTNQLTEKTRGKTDSQQLRITISETIQQYIQNESRQN